jgi:cyclic pyranopterin phosphate synthase
MCLYAAQGLDLRAPLRRGATDAELAAMLRDAWLGRTDRGAEERLALAERQPLYHVTGLRADPHREMHTRGG